MRRCAGVQNVSRPIDMCHEMSQYTPAITQSAATATVRACFTLEKTHLLAELLGLHGGLAEQALKRSRGFGRVSGEVVVDVSEHLAPLLGVRPEHLRPRLELAAAVHLDARVVDDPLVRPHP